MADPAVAAITQLRNIQARTGKTIVELLEALATSGLDKQGERRSWLLEHFKLGYGAAHCVALLVGKSLPDLNGTGAPAQTAPVGDPLDALYTGGKAGLRPLHDAVIAVVRAYGEFEEAPKKSYVSLRRKKQFAIVGPATKDSV